MDLDAAEMGRMIERVFRETTKKRMTPEVARGYMAFLVSDPGKHFVQTVNARIKDALTTCAQAQDMQEIYQAQGRYAAYNTIKNFFEQAKRRVVQEKENDATESRT